MNSILGKPHRAQGKFSYPSEAGLRLQDETYCSPLDAFDCVDVSNDFTSCDGSFLYDQSGTAFVDLRMSYAAVNFGYRNERLTRAALEQLNRPPQACSQYLQREKVRLATLIAQDAERTFSCKGRVRFNDSGSHTVKDSLDLVQNYSAGKNVMFAFEGGNYNRALGASGCTSRDHVHGHYRHFGDRTRFVELPYYYRGPKGMTKEEYCDICIRKFSRFFEGEYSDSADNSGSEMGYSAFYVEAIHNTGGYIIPPSNFFIDLKKVLDQYGILLVVDETQMGAYRTGKLWSIEHYAVSPDALIFGKSITNGIDRLSGLWAREEIINPEVLPPLPRDFALADNPMGLAVALEVMRMFQEEDFSSVIMSKGTYFLEGLKSLQKYHKIVGAVDGIGLALRVEICQDDSYTPDKTMADWLYEEAMKGDLQFGGKMHGLVFDVGGFRKNIMILSPNLLISYSEIDLALALMDQLLTRAKNR